MAPSDNDFPELGAAHRAAAFVAMRAGAAGGHAAACAAPEGDVDLDRFGSERVGGDAVEDVVGVERPVIAATPAWSRPTMRCEQP